MRHLATLLAGLLVCACLPKLLAADIVPNIVLIVADDLGYSDLGCYGSEIRTPNLDALASKGARYSQFYNAARCCPSRACLLTGLYPHQAGVGHMTYDAGEPGYRGELNRDVPTMAEVLQESGYFTAMVGKWHVTPNTKPESPQDNWPRQRGFDEFYGTLPGHGSLWEPKGLMRNNTPVKPAKDFFYTDAIADHAADFINDAKARPLFLYVAFTAPHYPLHAREQTIASYEGVYDVGWDEIRRRRHARLIEIGLLPNGSRLAPRDPASIPWEKTPGGKPVRAGDWPGEPLGGPATYGSYGPRWANVSNTPFRRHKSWVHEGGIATPCIVSAPFRAGSRGTISHQPAHLVDLLPTMANLAGRSKKLKTEGRDLFGNEGRSEIGWEHEGNRAYRKGNWKIVSEFPGTWTTMYPYTNKGRWELYDLANDRTELNDLAKVRPGKLKEMVRAYEKWAKRIGVVPWDKLAGKNE